MDPAQYSSKEFAACFFAAANSLFLISESFLMSLAIIPSSFKIMKFFLEPRTLVTPFDEPPRTFPPFVEDIIEEKIFIVNNFMKLFSSFFLP